MGDAGTQAMVVTAAPLPSFARMSEKRTVYSDTEEISVTTPTRRDLSEGMSAMKVQSEVSIVDETMVEGLHATLMSLVISLVVSVIPTLNNGRLCLV